MTRQRLFLETIEDVLQKSNKVIIDEGKAGPGVVPYLPLPELQKRQRPAGAHRHHGRPVMAGLRTIVIVANHRPG